MLLHATYLLLDQEEGHAVRLERPAQLNVAVPGIELRHALQLAVLLEDALLQALDLGVFRRQKLFRPGYGYSVYCE